MARRTAPQAQLRIEWDTAPASPAPSAIVAALAPPAPPPPAAVVAVASDAPPRKGYDRALADRAVAGAVKALTKAHGDGKLGWHEIMPRWLDICVAASMAQASALARDQLATAMLTSALSDDAAGFALARDYGARYDKAAAQHEATYMAAIKDLPRPTLDRFIEAFGWVSLAARATWDDTLARIYEALASNAGRSHMGQYFTPAPVCRMMAGISLGEFSGDAWTRERRCRIYDPACGAGSMILAAAGIIAERDPLALHDGRVSFIMADLDPTCCQMARLNASLHSIWHCTNVLHGNSLSAEIDSELAWLFKQGA